MNILDIRLQEDLEAALDAAAPDGPSWLAGEAAFWSMLPQGRVGDAIVLALDAAAPDESSWLAGEAAFLDRYTKRTVTDMLNLDRFSDKRWPKRPWRETLGLKGRN